MIHHELVAFLGADGVHSIYGKYTKRTVITFLKRHLVCETVSRYSISRPVLLQDEEKNMVGYYYKNDDRNDDAHVGVVLINMTPFNLIGNTGELWDIGARIVPKEEGVRLHLLRNLYGWGAWM